MNIKYINYLLLTSLTFLNASNINENSLNLLKDIEKTSQSIEKEQDTYKPSDENVNVKNNNLEIKPEVVLYNVENKNLEANLHFISYYYETFKTLYEDLTHTKRLEEELKNKADEGLLFYKTYLEKYFKMSAYEYANMYPKEKWDNLFSADSIGFQTSIKQQYPELVRFIYSSTYNENIENLHIFLNRNAKFNTLRKDESLSIKEKIDKIFNEKDEKYYEPIKEDKKIIEEENEEVAKFTPVLTNPLKNNDKPMQTEVPKESATTLNNPYPVAQEETLSF